MPIQLEQLTTVPRIPDLGGAILTQGGQPRPVRRPVHPSALQGQGRRAGGVSPLIDGVIRGLTLLAGRHFSSTGELPHLDRPIDTPCRQPLPVWRPGYGIESIRMALEGEQYPAVAHLPHHHRALTT